MRRQRRYHRATQRRVQFSTIPRVRGRELRPYQTINIRLSQAIEQELPTLHVIQSDAEIKSISIDEVFAVRLQLADVYDASKFIVNATATIIDDLLNVYTTTAKAHTYGEPARTDLVIQFINIATGQAEQPNNYDINVTAVYNPIGSE